MHRPSRESSIPLTRPPSLVSKDNLILRNYCEARALVLDAPLRFHRPHSAIAERVPLELPFVATLYRYHPPFANLARAHIERTRV